MEGFLHHVKERAGVRRIEVASSSRFRHLSEAVLVRTHTHPEPDDDEIHIGYRFGQTLGGLDGISSKAIHPIGDEYDSGFRDFLKICYCFRYRIGERCTPSRLDSIQHLGEFPPVEGLDGEGARLVIDAINSAARRGRTVVVFTHDPRILAAVPQYVDLNSKPVPRLVRKQPQQPEAAKPAEQPARPTPVREVRS